MSSKFLSYWYMALREPVGMLFESTNVASAMTRLYTARKQSGDPELQSLVIMPDPEDKKSRFYITRSASRAAKLEEKENG